jgi:photosystem II stability/assembly factor-like uncharacterized protein
MSTGSRMLRRLFGPVVLLIAVVSLLATSGSAAGGKDPIRLLQSGRDVSLRGLSVVNDQIIWASGTKGTLVRSTDGGASWQWFEVGGLGERDLRDLEAFDRDRVVVIAVGSPALILRTEDGGQSWTEAYRNDDPDAFLDGLAFWDARRGVAFGDPLKGRLLVLWTDDGGASWREVKKRGLPVAAPGEAGFAASGTSIRAMTGGIAVLGTGGSKARIWSSQDYGHTWTVWPTPMRQGKGSQGIFSLAEGGDGRWLIVGGDYEQPDAREANAFWSANQGRSWNPVETPPGGYRSGVETIRDDRLITTGPNGTDVSSDGGRTWMALSAEGFHVVRAARDGAAVYFAGADGRIGRLEKVKPGPEPESE